MSTILISKRAGLAASALALGLGVGALPLSGAADAKRKPRRQDHRLHVQATADPLVPVGKTAKVIFRATGVIKGRRYRLLVSQRSGQRPFVRDQSGHIVQQCGGIGSLTLRRAPRSGVLEWPATPLRLQGSEPDQHGYDTIGAQPCHGTYKGELEELAGSRSTGTVFFTIQVPSLNLRETWNDS